MTKRITKKQHSAVRLVVRSLPLVVLDVAATVVAFLIAAWGTKAGEVDLASPYFIGQMVCLSVVNVVVFGCFRMYNSMWEYASVDDAGRIVVATVAGSVIGDVLGALVFDARMPFRVYLCAWAVLLVICGMTRFAIRVNSKGRSWSFFGAESPGQPRTLIVGAGESGSLVVNRMLAGTDDVIGSPVGYLDDDLHKIGRRIHGIKVLGPCGAVAQICKRHAIDQIVVAIPSGSQKEKRRIYDLCMQTGCKVLTLPEKIKDLPEEEIGKVSVRDVEVSDLLARDEVALDESLVGGYLTGATVLVTGGGGSIGSELVRQLLPARPSKIILFDVYENTVYELFHEISGSARDEGIEIITEIGSITHKPALEEVFDRYEPQVVFHAAAHKHVPLMESNPREAIENNIFGTENVAQLAHERRCSHFILISTDKAVNPANVMGATKRMCEMIVQNYAEFSPTVFSAVRFGNVLGSHGSVIPLFKRQLKQGGPITLTHKDITRYFMTIPEAARLVITAGALAEGGEIFVLDMGEPVRIYDLAENLIRLSGLKVGEDIEIEVTGLRPGEKLYEELNMSDEPTEPTANGAITVIKGTRPEVADVGARLRRLGDSINLDRVELKKVLGEVVPTYTPEYQ
ncbi:MAG: nucleoside-diphosphate sugar epimerase/dehydratase [Adlercreutzia sp.]|nr:nucleoside-diphosphate sugar epimerase/dehydratase [Adlercreutzia sp.]